MLTHWNRGALYALLAAALNASIGTLSKPLLEADALPPASVAFLRCLLGYLLIRLLIPGLGRLRAHPAQVAICALLGIFTLFFFETAAYAHELAANVVLMLMASAALSAYLGGWLLLGERPGPWQWLGLLLCILGLALVFGVKATFNWAGCGLAALAGSGYGLFSVLAKRWQLPGGLLLVRALLGWGSLYLSLPFLQAGAVLPQAQWPVLLALLALAVLPSIAGFWCTTRAITTLGPARTQLLELSEPVFALILAWLVLNERPGWGSYLGGALMLGGLFVAQRRR